MHSRFATGVGFALLLSGCTGSLPPAPFDRAEGDILPLIASKTIEFCETAEGEQTCLSPEGGLKAAGVGGLFLPLATEVRSVSFGTDDGAIDLKVNGIPAACTKGELDIRAGEAQLSGILCNWLLIGNVVSSLTLTVDWVESENRFGGRYAIGFSGTGNGSGSGHYRAEGAVQ